MKPKVIIGIVVVALLAVVGYLAFGAESKPAVGPDANTAPTTKTYQNDEHGISFDYPAQYVVSDEIVKTADGPVFAIRIVRPQDAIPREVEGDGPPMVSIHFFSNAEQRSLTDWVKMSQNSNYQHGDGTLTTSTVAGVPALEYGWDGLYQGRTTALLRGSDAVAVAVDLDEPDGDLVHVYRGVLNTLQLK